MKVGGPAGWLPRGKSAAICLSVDDVHPASSGDGRGADVARRSLEHLGWLQARHPRLRATLFVTADWRPRASGDREPPRPAAARPARAFQVPVHPPRTFRLDRHEEFCALLREAPRVEIALHGLHHVRRGPRPVVEFAGQSASRCRALLVRAMEIFRDARLPFLRGVCPPGWEAPPALVTALSRLDMEFLASARDLETPIAPNASTNGSGLRGVPLLYPHVLPGTSLVHIPTNFQATSSLSRARAVLSSGGLLSIKAHLLERFGSYRALDGLTPKYRRHLDRVLSTLADEFGDRVWWTSHAEVAQRIRVP